MCSRLSWRTRSVRLQGVLLALLLLLVLGILVVPGVINHMSQTAIVSNWGATAIVNHSGSVAVVSNWSQPNIINHS